MRRVLIVTGSYAPTMIADMHRARQLAWQLPECGWEVEICCPDDSYQPPSCRDPDGAAFFAGGIATHHVRQFLPQLLPALGMNSISARAILPMLRAGRRLFSQRRYDLVYISTAQFLLFLLGAVWRRQFGIPFVLDLHDPLCVVDMVARPGVRHRISRSLTAQVESWAAPAASGLISVSPRYLDTLRDRYARRKPAWLAADRQAVIPFAFLPRDLEEAARGLPARREGQAPAKIIYVGSGGQLMARAFALLCRALAQLRPHRARLLDGVRIELHGTASAVGGDDGRSLADLARELGVADLVSEAPSRVTYRRSLELLLQGDGALVLGVDDAGYMPSKLFTYAYSGKPLLASVHKDGPALAALRGTAGFGRALWFGDGDEMPLGEAADVVAAFLEDVVARRHFDRRAGLEHYSAASMARRHAEVFEACLQQAKVA